jgi:hypothetical protein
MGCSVSCSWVCCFSLPKPVRLQVCASCAPPPPVPPHQNNAKTPLRLPMSCRLNCDFLAACLYVNAHHGRRLLLRHHWYEQEKGKMACLYTDDLEEMLWSPLSHSPGPPAHSYRCAVKCPWHSRSLQPQVPGLLDDLSCLNPVRMRRVARSNGK